MYYNLAVLYIQWNLSNKGHLQDRGDLISIECVYMGTLACPLLGGLYSFRVSFIIIDYEVSLFTVIPLWERCGS